MEQRVVLFPSNEQAYAYRKQCACSGDSTAFGLNAVSFTSWVQDLWGLYGDGRAIASALDRQFAVRACVAALPPAFGAVTDGYVSLVSHFLREACGTDALEQALAAPPDSLSSAEFSVLDVVVEYRRQLQAQGLIELGDAVCALACAPLPLRIELAAGFDAPTSLVDLAKRAGIELVSMETEEPRVTALKEPCKPAFLIAAGPSAQNALIADYLAHALQNVYKEQGAASALVVTARPFELFSLLSRAFGAGCQCSLRTLQPFVQTEFGRCINALGAFLLDEQHSASALQDFFASPFSGMDPVRVAQADSEIRGNRLMSYEELLALAGLASPNFECFSALFADSTEEAFSQVEEIVASVHGDEAYIAEQLSALACLKSACQQSQKWGIGPADLIASISNAGVNASRVSGEGSVSITVIDSAAAATAVLEPHDVVLLCDLDNRYYAMAESHNALVTLQMKLGMQSCEPVLTGLRRTFERVKAAAVSQFACQRVADAGGDEDVYPAVVLDDYCEALRLPEEELGKYGIPEHLQHAVLERGEELFSANSDPCGIAPKQIELSVAEQDELDVSTLLLKRSEDGTPALSPSAIEAYVNCPYKWFIANRLRPEAPDEEFGPLEQGVFVHSVWEAFYARIEGELGAKRVTYKNLEKAQELLGSVFDAELAKQRDCEPPRFVPLTATEQAQAAKLRATLLDNLAVQAGMLPGFEPLCHELAIKPEDGITYAGVRLNGRADRVDVNGQLGQYVVLDYKGGIVGHDAGYKPDEAELSEEEGEYSDFKLPQKVQALIYAQALRKGKVNGHPVGALYLSYRANSPKSSLAGSYDSSMLDVEDRARGTSSVNMNFERYLDLVEQRIEERLQGLLAGDVSPNPLCSDSCRYCPAVNCEKRL